MAPLDPAGTDRWYLEYKTTHARHEICFRSGGLAGVDTVTTALIAYCNAVKPYLYQDVVFDKLRHSNTGSNLSFPIAWTPIAGTSPGTAQPKTEAPLFMSFTGRSSQGRRVRITQFGIQVAWSDDFRITYGENAVPAAILGALEAHTNVWVAIDGFAIMWNQYANTGFNAYWQRQSRDQ